jgi:hypothetical protein
MKSEKPTCGLCGKKTKDLTKTPCCDNWICDDVHEYVLFSYDTNSCYRNHDRYTLCATHSRENHAGIWQECKKCKNEYPIENYVDFGTNDFNFEKLKNPPKVTIKCVSCGFQSNTAQDFAYQTSNGWYCCKSKCQKAAMNF